MWEVEQGIKMAHEKPLTKKEKAIILSVPLGTFLMILFLIIFDNISEHYTKNWEKEIGTAHSDLADSIKSESWYQEINKDGISHITTTIDYGTYREENPFIINAWVQVEMNQGFEDNSFMDKCERCVLLTREIEDAIDDLYKDSTFFHMYKKKENSDRKIYYYGHYWRPKLEVQVSLYGSSYEYCIVYNGDLAVSLKQDNTCVEFYEYTLKDGHLTALTDRNGNPASPPIRDSREKTSSTGTGSAAPSTSASEAKDKTQSTSGSAYDPYDAKDYNSSQDFADDKYEEFYDYEDEYEDEDEAYDAAEDYWNDEY